MPLVPEQAGVLADLRDSLAQGETLESIACQAIGQGFVTCNLAMDLADFFVAVILRDEQKIAGEIAYGQLYPCLLGEASQTLAAAIEALPEEEELLREYHPWRVVNQWLALEALAREVGHRACSPRQIALDVFERTLAGSWPVEACCGRGEPARAAFSTWFDRHAGKLAVWLHNLRPELVQEPDEDGPRLGNLSCSDLRVGLVRRLAELLDVEPVVQLTINKNSQLQNCVQRIRAATEPPDDLPGWIRRLYNAMKDAEECRRDFSLDAGLAEVLRQLISWVQEQGLAGRGGTMPPLLEKLAALLDQFSESWAKHPGKLTLAAAMCELKEVADLVRRRALPRDWANDRHVEDLFSHPMKGGFQFSAWREKTLGFGLGRS